MPPTSISDNILYPICGGGILQGVLLAMLVMFHPKNDRPTELWNNVKDYFKNYNLHFKKNAHYPQYE